MEIYAILSVSFSKENVLLADSQREAETERQRQQMWKNLHLWQNE